MTKLKKELFEFDKNNQKVVFYYGKYLEESIILKFLNYKFENQKSDAKYLRDFAKIFEYDELLEANILIPQEEIVNLKDYYQEVGYQISYFQALQEELRPALKEVIQNMLSPKVITKELISNGPYHGLEDHLEDLGELVYEPLFGDLNLKWKDKPISFIQALLRSLIGFTKYDKKFLKYVVFCNNCDAIFINSTGRTKFCSRRCSVRFGDSKRDNRARYLKEISSLKYSRSRAIDNN